mgnify:CR=1 FL=1
MSDIVRAERQANAHAKCSQPQNRMILCRELYDNLCQLADLEFNFSNHFVAAFFKKGLALGPVGPRVCDQFAIDVNLG